MSHFPHSATEAGEGVGLGRAVRIGRAALHRLATAARGDDAAEFVFPLGGAIELMVQLAGERRRLGL